MTRNGQSDAWSIASDEDCAVGYLLHEDGMPMHRDALLGAFIVLAKREWGMIYDPSSLEISRKPKGYRLAADGERMVPARKTADSHWWVIKGLDDAEVRFA